MNSNLQLRSWVWMFALVPVMAGAGCALGEQPDDEGIGRVSSDLIGGQGGFWPGTPPMIPVCWENPSNGVIQGNGFTVAEPTARAWVRDVIEGQWSRYARVNFTEWDTCTSGTPGIHIRINKTEGSSAPFGTSGNGVDNGVQLNLYFNDRPADCQATQANLQHCAQATALHEFGHVLGFGHEETRPDYPAGGSGDCAKQPTPPGQTSYGAYDIDSVMSYCGQPIGDIAPWKVRLRPGNIAAVQRAYGRRKSGQLANVRGADMLSSNLFSTPDAFVWDADEAEGQRWRYNFAKQTFKVSSGGLAVCLDTFPGGAGKPLRATTCMNDEFQRFPLDDLFVRGFGGLCLDVPGGAAVDGTPLQAWDCGALGGVNQRWRIDTQGRIRFGTTSKCVTFTPTQGASLFLSECGAAPNQNRQSPLFADNGALLLPDGAGDFLCADLEGPTDAQYLAGLGLPHNGAPVKAFQCRNEQLNQKWNLSGAFRNVNGACIDVVSAGVANGTGVQSFGCNGTVAQEWDYYWRQ